ncbi:MAG: glycosyltransferase [Bacteroidales bacterium]|nr:glycosyltransferase [Bacteroidales bacterium]
MKEPVISVCMITYNHARFIREAIESILNQNINCDFELVIGEDLSTDGTREICEDYQSKHPEIIRLLPQKKRLGMSRNFFRTLLACRGKYIAICEGDDYWIDSSKLQKQFELMEKNSLYSMCFHNTIVIDEIHNHKKLFGSYRRRMYEGRDLLKEWLMATSAVFFRNVLKEPLPYFFYHATHPDLVLFLYVSDFGPIAYIDEIMSVYRIHHSGITKTSFENNLLHYVCHINQIKHMIGYWGEKYRPLLKKRMANYYISTSYLFIKEKRKEKAFFFLKKFLLTKKYTFNHFITLIKIFWFLLTKR